MAAILTGRSIVDYRTWSGWSQVRVLPLALRRQGSSVGRAPKNPLAQLARHIFGRLAEFSKAPRWKREVTFTRAVERSHHLPPFVLTGMADCKTIVVNKRHQSYDVYIGRPSKWGNPFVIGQDGDRARVIELYRRFLLKSPELLKSLHELRGKRLGCYCAPLPCHGDVLAEFAERLVDRVQ